MAKGATEEGPLAGAGRAPKEFMPQDVEGLKTQEVRGLAPQVGEASPFGPGLPARHAASRFGEQDSLPHAPTQPFVFEAGVSPMASGWDFSSLNDLRVDRSEQWREHLHEWGVLQQLQTEAACLPDW